MNIRVARRRVMKVLESDKSVLEKYNKIRKYFVPHTEKNAKKTINKVLPYLKSIYNDQTARDLVTNLDFEKTADFISFLETNQK